MKQDRKKPKDIVGKTEIQTRKIRQHFMSQDLYDELIESVREGGAILRGEKEPARTYPVDNSA